jgi:biopolymer transport protein ExbB/TolQ
MNITEQFKSFALFGAEWVMWILIVLSIISISIMVERAIFFYGQRPSLDDLIKQIKDFLKKKDYEGAIKHLDATKGVAPKIVMAALKEASNGAHAVEEAGASARIRTKLRLVVPQEI